MEYGHQLKLPGLRVFMATGIIIGFVAAGCGEKPVETKEVVRPVKMITVGSEDDSSERKFPGSVRAAQRVDLAFNVSGTLAELPVSEGDDVKKGDLLARLDRRDFKSNLASANAKHKNAKSDYDRNAKLLKEGVISRAHFDQLEKNLKVYESDATIAQKDFDDSSLLAPFEGRIARRYVDNFKEVRAKEPIVSLQDISSIEVVVDVPEWVMVPIRKRGSADVTAEFHAVPGKQYPLKLKEFASEADPETQTYRVVLIMPAPDDVNILPGMTATVTGSGLKDSLNRKSIQVPVSAVFADEGGKNHVWLVDDSMKVRKQEVQVEGVTGESIHVVHGLSKDDRVVTAGVNYLQPGMKVRELKSKTGE
jgi:RND family efflux transporter MFP subunit